MRSLHTSASRFLSAISLAGALCLLSGCPNETQCGIGGAPEAGLLVTGTDVALEFGDLEYGQNNDCPIVSAPEGVISVTIAGRQVGGTGLITFCIPRPDLSNGGEQLIADDPTLQTPEIRVVDIIGDADGCTFSFDDAVQPTGGANTRGLCEAGANLDGFAFEIDGTAQLTRTCGVNVDTVIVTLSGRTAALPQP
jgi:hypothetical protein